MLSMHTNGLMEIFSLSLHCTVSSVCPIYLYTLRQIDWNKTTTKMMNIIYSFPFNYENYEVRDAIRFIVMMKSIFTSLKLYIRNYNTIVCFIYSQRPNGCYLIIPIHYSQGYALFMALIIRFVWDFYLYLVCSASNW